MKYKIYKFQCKFTTLNFLSYVNLYMIKKPFFNNVKLTSFISIHTCKSHALKMSMYHSSQMRANERLFLFRQLNENKLNNKLKRSNDIFHQCKISLFHNQTELANTT